MEDANGSELKMGKDVCLSGRASQSNHLVMVHLLTHSLIPSRRSSPDRPGNTKVQILRGYQIAIAIQIISKLRQSDAYRQLFLLKFDYFSYLLYVFFCRGEFCAIFELVCADFCFAYIQLCMKNLCLCSKNILPSPDNDF